MLKMGKRRRDGAYQLGWRPEAGGRVVMGFVCYERRWGGSVLECAGVGWCGMGIES